MAFRILILYFFLYFPIVAFANAVDGEDLSSEIDSQEQLCSTDRDCVVVETKCQSNGCECGKAVSVENFTVYKKKLNDCRAEQTMMAICEYLCPTPYPRCVDGRCVLSAQSVLQHK